LLLLIFIFITSATITLKSNACLLSTRKGYLNCWPWMWAIWGFRIESYNPGHLCLGPSLTDSEREAIIWWAW
jgi:hypothetical protein